MNKEFTSVEMNEEIMDILNKHLIKFCFGEYKEEATYPVVLIKSKMTACDSETEFYISCRLNKNSAGVLRRVMFTINKYPNT